MKDFRELAEEIIEKFTNSEWYPISDAHIEPMSILIAEALSRQYERGVKDGEAKSKHDIDIREAVIKNECENEAEFRKIAKKVLAEHEVEGDSYGVPMIQDVGKLLVTKAKDSWNEAVEACKKVAEKRKILWTSNGGATIKHHEHLTIEGELELVVESIVKLRRE